MTTLPNTLTIPSPDKTPGCLWGRFGVATVLAFTLTTGNALAEKTDTTQQAAASNSPRFVCADEECIKHDLSSQDTCTEVTQPATRNAAWSEGMGVQKTRELLGGQLVAYKIQWFNGGWSDWYVPGVNDIDWKYNGQNASLRRVWSYFEDHTHHFILCK